MLMDNELLLIDRLGVIKDTITRYGEENFYISFSGGKDSTVLHYLVDMAIPNNTIPRVFCNTGIEYVAIVDFVKELASKDNRFEIITSKVNIKKMLEEKGYPFKSKEHSVKMGEYQKGSRTKSVLAYVDRQNGENNRFSCPTKLLYQKESDFKIKLSARCCYVLKKTPFHQYEKESKRTIALTGMRNAEGSQRANLTNCIITSQGKVVKFHPMLKVTEDWENWFIDKYNIQLCKLYYEPYNFKRTGCKGCPYSLDLQKQLETMERYLPIEAKQCEYIWKPIYEEYRRIGYRLKKYKQRKLF